MLDCKTWKFEKLKLPENLGSINVVDFCRSAEGGIYIVNHYDFILHYDPNDNKYTIYRQEDLPGLPMSFRSIADDGQGKLYIGHANYGFSVVNLKTKKIENFIHEPGRINSLPGNNVKIYLLTVIKISGLVPIADWPFSIPGRKTFLHSHMAALTWGT